MTSRELLRALRRLGATFHENRGKGGHGHVPTGSGELKTGLVHGVLKQLGLTIRDLR